LVTASNSSCPAVSHTMNVMLCAQLQPFRKSQTQHGILAQIASWQTYPLQSAGHMQLDSRISQIPPRATCTYESADAERICPGGRWGIKAARADLSMYFSFSRKSTPIVFLYVSVYSPVQNRRIIDDFPTPPLPTTITLMVAGARSQRSTIQEMAKRPAFRQTWPGGAHNAKQQRCRCSRTRGLTSQNACMSLAVAVPSDR